MAAPAAAVLGAAFAVLLGACQGAGRADAGATSNSSPVTSPETGATPPPGASPWRVLPDESELVVEVYRAGSLARLGHNHVVSTRAITGMLFLATPFDESTLELAVSKSELQVDDPDRRADAGEQFADPIPADAVAATRENMLGVRLLDAARYPEVLLRSLSISGKSGDFEVRAGVRIHDRWYELTFPVHVELEDDRLRATGTRRVSHEALGLEPYSVMMGALSVRDDMNIQYSITAEPLR